MPAPKKSRVHQILDSFGVPLGNAGVADARISYISIHYDSYQIGPSKPRKIGPLIFASKVRDASNQLGTNPALGGAGPVDFSGNYVRHLFDYLIASVRDSNSLSQFSKATEVQYEDGFYQGSATFMYKQDSPLQGSGLQASVAKRAGNFGTVSVVSGLDGVTKSALPYVVSVPQNLTFEVANIRDCDNIPALARSIERGKSGAFHADSAPPDPTDPIDVAAEDIAHGLVEYYESYVPGFKQKACKNLKNSDWKDHMPDWCTSGGGGGGGGANVPDIDDVRPDSIEVDVWMTDGAASESVEVSFGNVGNADLLATISSDSPIASIGPPDVYPAGTAAPLGGSQSVRVQPGERARVEVGFQCTEAGDYTDSIAIRSNDPDEPEVELPVVVHCHSGVRILVGGYDIERGTFYTSYYDPSNDADEVFYIPETTAVNYVLEADAGWADLSHPEYGFWFTAINNEEEQLEYWLETPEWLTLSPDRGALQPDESYDLGFTEAQGFCDGPEEKNGYITIHSNDRSNPIVQIPVRLMCGAIEVEFDPKEYNSIEKPLTEWCTSMHGRGVVKGADHLKELFLRIEYEDDEGYEKPVSVEFDTPNMSYLFTKGNWSSIRWPQISGDWNWDEHPVFRFDSWTSSCVFDIGTYEVKDFQYAMFKSPSAGTVTIDNNAFPGAVYDLAERCQDGSCTPLDIKHKIEGAEQPTRELELQHGSWERSTHSFVTGYQYDVDFLDGDTLVDTASGNVGAVLDPEKIIYCTSFTALSSLRTRDGSRVSLAESGDPINLFWGHVVEYDYENRDSYVTETISGAWCYEPWDKEGAGSESKRLRQASAPPWKRGIKPQWVPGEVLFCQKRDCYGHQLESIDDGNPPDW